MRWPFFFFLQENYEFLSCCIREHLGFKEGKPLAACIIYNCLLHWRAFESERTAIFDFIIEGINEVLKVIHPQPLLNLLVLACSVFGLEGSRIFTNFFCNCFRLGMKMLLCLTGCQMHQHFSASCRGTYGPMDFSVHLLSALHVGCHRELYMWGIQWRMSLLKFSVLWCKFLFYSSFI